MPQSILDLLTDELIVSLGNGDRSLYSLVLLLLALKYLVKCTRLALEPFHLRLQRCNAVVVAQFSRRLVLFLAESLQLLLDAKHVTLLNG